MFMQVAIGAIGIGIVLMVGYLIIAEVNAAMQTSLETSGLGVNETLNITKAMSATQNVVFSGFALIAVGVIVLAAFGLINIFQ